MKLEKIITISLTLLLLLVIVVKKNINFQDYNPTVIVKNHKFDNKQNKELLKGDKVIGEFIAENNHLGTVSIKFNTHNRINNDYLQFRIKKSDSNHWYYSNKYKVDYFQNNQYFSFGFPPINDSKDKKYQIEIESLAGVKGKSIQALMEDSPFLSKYSFPKAYLQQNKKEIQMFIFSKLKSYLGHIDLNVYLSLLIVSLLLFYILRLIRIKKLLVNFKKFEGIFIKGSKSFFIKNKNKLINKSILINNSQFLVKIKIYFDRNSIKIFLVILLVTIFSRFNISYKTSSDIITPPESVFYLSPLGRDFYTGAILPTKNMLEGKTFYDSVANYGSSVYITIAPILSQIIKDGVCDFSTILICHNYLYKKLLVLTFFVYLVFLGVCFKKLKLKDHILFFLLISIFLLQLPFSAGFERGNLDIILSALIGLLYLISKPYKFGKNSHYFNLFQSLLIGLLGGYITNAKIFLLPFALSSILVSSNILLSLVSFLISFIGLGYIPIVYGMPTTIFDLVSTSLNWQKSANSLFSLPSYLVFNHSIPAISTLFTNCVKEKNCLLNNSLTNFVTQFFSIAIFLFVFVLPFISIKSIFKIINQKIVNRKIFQIIFVSLYKVFTKRRNWRILMFLFILSTAIINLIPKNAYTYRLLYSIPLIFLLINETRNNQEQRHLLLLSIFFFTLNGLWFFFQIKPEGWNMFDARFMNLFLIIHYYFLIKLGYSKLKET